MSRQVGVHMLSPSPQSELGPDLGMQCRHGSQSWCGVSCHRLVGNATCPCEPGHNLSSHTHTTWQDQVFSHTLTSFLLTFSDQTSCTYMTLCLSLNAITQPCFPFLEPLILMPHVPCLVFSPFDPSHPQTNQSTFTYFHFHPSHISTQKHFDSTALGRCIEAPCWWWNITVKFPPSSFLFALHESLFYLTIRTTKHIYHLGCAHSHKLYKYYLKGLIIIIIFYKIKSLYFK